MHGCDGHVVCNGECSCRHRYWPVGCNLDNIHFCHNVFDEWVFLTELEWLQHEYCLLISVFSLGYWGQATGLRDPANRDSSHGLEYGTRRQLRKSSGSPPHVELADSPISDIEFLCGIHNPNTVGSIFLGNLLLVWRSNGSRSCREHYLYARDKRPGSGDHWRSIRYPERKRSACHS